MKKDNCIYKDNAKQKRTQVNYKITRSRPKRHKVNFKSRARSRRKLTFLLILWFGMSEPESSMRPTVMTVFAMLMKLLLATLIHGLSQMAAGGNSVLHLKRLINYQWWREDCL